LGDDAGMATRVYLGSTEVAEHRPELLTSSGSG
jgi:hypothetical protein